MLGRKQSLRPELADYGPDETLNESSDIEWVGEWVSTGKIVVISRKQ